MRVELSPAAEPAVTSEPIVAWRAWTLTGRADLTHLRLRPVAGRRLPWPPLRPAHASCKQLRAHHAPDLDCSCGLHGTHGLDILRRTKGATVLGTTALWGRVIEHQHGYRGEFAYPQRLRLVCLLCFCWRDARVAPPPEAVALIERGRLLPLCDRHLATAVRYGLRARQILDAADVQAALLGTYAVDLLA